MSRSQQQRAIDWFDLSKSYWGHNPIMIRLHGGPNVATWILVDRLRDIVWPNQVTMLHGISAMSIFPKRKSLGNLLDIKLKSQWYLLDVKQKSRWVGPVHYNYNNSSFLKTNIFSIWLNSWNISTICVPHATVAAVSQSLLMYFFCSKSSFLCRSSVNLASPLETDICFLATILTSYLGVRPLSV